MQMRVITHSSERSLAVSVASFTVFTHSHTASSLTHSFNHTQSPTNTPTTLDGFPQSCLTHSLTQTSFKHHSRKPHSLTHSHMQTTLNSPVTHSLTQTTLIQTSLTHSKPLFLSQTCTHKHKWTRGYHSWSHRPLPFWSK